MAVVFYPGPTPLPAIANPGGVHPFYPVKMPEFLNDADDGEEASYGFVG